MKAGEGVGVGERLESPVETHSIFVVFFFSDDGPLLVVF